MTLRTNDTFQKRFETLGWLVSRACPAFFIGSKTEGREQGRGYWVGTHPHQLGGLGALSSDVHLPFSNGGPAT